MKRYAAVGSRARTSWLCRECLMSCVTRLTAVVCNVSLILKLSGLFILKNLHFQDTNAYEYRRWMGYLVIQLLIHSNSLSCRCISTNENYGAINDSLADFLSGTLMCQYERGKELTTFSITAEYMLMEVIYFSNSNKPFWHQLFDSLISHPELSRTHFYRENYRLRLLKDVVLSFTSAAFKICAHNTIEDIEGPLWHWLT